MLNVGERSVRSARQVLDEGVPELFAAVEQGQVAVSLAAKVAQADPDIQREVVEKVHQGARTDLSPIGDKSQAQAAAQADTRR